MRGAAIRRDSRGICDGCHEPVKAGYSPSGTAEIPVAGFCRVASRDAADFAKSAIQRSIFANSGLNFGDLARAKTMRGQGRLA
jgi:hypothetical protein